MSSKPKSDPKPQGKKRANASSTPKQPLSTPERLRRLFTALCAQIDGGHFGGAVRTCDKILRLAPTDPDAHKTKLFLLLQTEQYAAALALLALSPGDDPQPSHDEQTQDPHAFEHAYALYRLQREDEARAVLARVKPDQDRERERERAVRHLEAQMCYRSGSYDQAVELYTQLLETAEPGTEEHTDILTNLHAAQLHLDFTTTGFKHALDLLPKSLTASIQSAPAPAPTPASAPVLATASFAVAVAAPEEKDAEKEKKAREPRRSRVPRGVVPGVTPPPDPERWLKKSERSSFGGRRRKGAGAGGATQGSANVESAVAAAAAAAGKAAGKGKRRK